MQRITLHWLNTISCVRSSCQESGPSRVEVHAWRVLLGGARAHRPGQLRMGLRWGLLTALMQTLHTGSQRDFRPGAALLGPNGKCLLHYGLFQPTTETVGGMPTIGN